MRCLGCLLITVPIVGWVGYGASLVLKCLWHESALVTISVICILCGLLIAVAYDRDDDEKAGP